MFKIFQIIFLFLTSVLVANCKYFSVVAPATLRVDEPYKVSITSHGDSGEILRFKVAVKGVSQKGAYVEVFKKISVNSSQTRTTKFRVNLIKVFSCFLC